MIQNAPDNQDFEWLSKHWKFAALIEALFMKKKKINQEVKTKSQRRTDLVETKTRGKYDIKTTNILVEV